MSSNNGAALVVFGLRFSEHHNLHMQQVLREYDRLPAAINRGTLFASLYQLSKELTASEAERIQIWLRDGGAFPSPEKPTPFIEDDVMTDVDAFVDADVNESEDTDEEDWPEYNSQAFNSPSANRGLTDLVDVDEPNEDNSEVGDNDDSSDGNYANESGLLTRASQSNLAPVMADSTTETMTSNTTPAKEPSSTDIECAICADMCAPTSFPATTKITEKCDHDHDSRACFACIEQSITLKLTGGALNQVICLFCSEPLSHDDIKKYASETAFARYEYLLLLDTPGIVMCLSPTCKSGQTHPDKSNPMMTCLTCSFKTCVLHKLPWHEGKTCVEFDSSEEQVERLDEAEETARLLAKEQSKVCPSCLQGVFKPNGCDHMTCRCGKEWCFLCLASWENIMRLGAEAHAPTCTNHPRYVQPSKSSTQKATTTFTALVHGGEISEATLAAREARNRKRQAEQRILARAAAEKRIAEMERRAKEGKGTEVGGGSVERKKRKVKLTAPWEEGGVAKRSFL